VTPLRAEATEKRDRLASDGVSIWGKEQIVTSHSDATHAVMRAELHFANQDMRAAADAYRTAIGLLDQLEAGRPGRALRAFETAEAALARNDIATARDAYAIALAADPSREAAGHGLRRAERRQEVLERLAAARVHESSRELDMALAEYQQAVALDEEYGPAREGLKRVESMLEEHAFARAMSVALGALGRSEFSAARNALDEAKGLRPDSPALRDAERQLSERRRSSTLGRLERQADRQSQNEEWQAALDTYVQALNVNPNASFAIQGKLRVEQMLEMHSHMDALLAKPTDLQMPDRASFAQKVIEIERTSPDAGPSFRAKAEKLGVDLVRYNTPTQLTIRSDGQTRITIHRVGRLAPTLKRTLELRPGSYTATGTRSGYRDVRVDFSVPVGESTTITIACEDEI
jgi:tetratricopeptide (TPR) repeat protein